MLVGHAFPLHGRADVVALGGYVQVIGLVLFFSISGYLISQSWHRDPQLIRFLSRRSLRIFPGLAAVVVLSALVLGPLISSLPPAQYLHEPGVRAYFSNILLFPVYSLPGVFSDVPLPGIVNVSLWSLPAEFFCYLLVPLVGLIPRRVRAIVYLALGIASGAIAQVMVVDSIRVVVWGTDLSQAMSVWPYFLVGAAIASARMLPLRLDVALIALIGASIATPLFIDAAFAIWWFVMPYAVITLGVSSTPGVRAAGRFGDFSYGLYLWAFPIQQLMLTLLPDAPFAVSVALTLACSAVAAFASWHLVEKQALRFKPRTPPGTPPRPAVRSSATPASVSGTALS